MPEAVVDLSESVDIQKQDSIRNGGPFLLVDHQLPYGIDKEIAIGQSCQVVMISRVAKSFATLSQVATALFESFDVMLKLANVTLRFLGASALGLFSDRSRLLYVVDVSAVGEINRSEENGHRRK